MIYYSGFAPGFATGSGNHHVCAQKKTCYALVLANVLMQSSFPVCSFQSGAAGIYDSWAI